jgi:hypothetical protein
MAILNLPGIFENVLDGNLTIVPVNDAPIVLVLGQASRGDSEELFRVDRLSEASKAFGKTGSLVRGMYEVSNGGALNIRLMRIGATAAKLVLTDGLTITTVAKDDSAGTDYELFWDQSATRLQVYRASDDVLVYDNNPASPLDAVDLSEVTVDGDIAAETNSDLGTSSVPVTLEDADTVGGAVYTAGTDGLSLSRMKMYEALSDAYGLLDSADLDVVVPMDVYLDDLNVMDMTGATVSGLSLDTISDYPTPGADNDALGKLYTEEFEGVNYYWWWFPTAPNTADADVLFTADSGANIFPSVGSASATLKTDGTALTGSDFHEVNFAYQLADFCYTSSRDNTEMQGAIGVLPPTSFALKDVSNWIGKLPTAEEDANGNLTIGVGDNGTGLLGNKFMSGRRADATGIGKPGLTVDAIDGLFNGGFIATDTGWLDDAQQKDNNDHLIDLGKYITVTASHPILSNPSRSASYTASGAATYAGFFSVLPAESAPTNKILRQIRLPFRVSISKLDLLAGQRYTTFHAKQRGIVVSDAPTAARPDSDYQRVSTVRQVKAAVDAVRRVAEPFLGEGLTGAKIAALDTAIDGALKALVRQGVLQRYDSQVTSTPTQRVLGQATCELILVPAFELRQLTIVVSLAAS